MGERVRNGPGPADRRVRLVGEPGGSVVSELASREGFPAPEATEDAAVVRAMYRALEEDAVTLAGYLDPGIEWIDPMVTRLPFDGTRRGVTAVLRNAFRRCADGTGPRVSAETFAEFGDGVLVAGRFLEREADREPEGRPFLHECFVRAGRVVRIREYPAENERGG